MCKKRLLNRLSFNENSFVTPTYSIEAFVKYLRIPTLAITAKAGKYKSKGRPNIGLTCFYPLVKD